MKRYARRSRRSRRKTTLKRFNLSLLLIIVMIISSGCTELEDIKIFKHEEPKGVQEPIDADELELNSYYVKDGTKFILTLPLNGSGGTSVPNSGLSAEYKKRVLYAGPFEDTLIPTHYKGEIVAMSSKDADWDETVLERYKDLGYSVGFYNGEYDRDERSLSFKLTEKCINGTDFRTQLEELESPDIRVVAVDHKPLDETNTNIEAGLLVGMNKGEKHIISLYAGTYYHEMEVEADTQMFQSFEVYKFGNDLISDTPNGYRAFATPEYLNSGYYAINGKGLFRYVNFTKGAGSVEDAAVNEKYYKSDAERLAQFSRQYTFNVDQRTKNLTIAALYDDTSIQDETTIEGYAFAPDGTQYQLELDTDDDTLKLDLTEAMPGRWTANIVPQDIEIKSFEAIDNTPDQELTQEKNELVIDEDRENVVIRVYFENSVADQKLDEINITGTVIAPNGETYVLEKGEEEDLEKKRKLYLEYRLSYAPAGTYEVDINHYPERTTVSAPEVVNNTETHTETIVIEE